MKRLFRRAARRGDDATTLVDTNEARYHVGERWNYRTRAGEEGSLLTIVKVESSPNLGVIVHVSLDGLRLESPRAPGGVTQTIGHMPFAEASIDESVTTRASAGMSGSSDDGGYAAWRCAFDAGDAGIFTVSVADGVDFVAQTLRQ